MRIKHMTSYILLNSNSFIELCNFLSSLFLFFEPNETSHYQIKLSDFGFKLTSILSLKINFFKINSNKVSFKHYFFFKNKIKIARKRHPKFLHHIFQFFYCIYLVTFSYVRHISYLSLTFKIYLIFA
jgi:hypothetical protein